MMKPYEILEKQYMTPRGAEKLKRRLAVFWVILSLLFSGSVVMALSSLDFFMTADQKLEQELNSSMDRIAAGFQSDIEDVAIYSLRFAEEAKTEIEAMLMHSGISFEELNDDPEALSELQRNLYPILNGRLRDSNCSGAYMVLNATSNTKAEGAFDSRSGLYIKSVNQTGMGATDPDITFFRGIPEVARQRGIEFHNRWNLEFDISELPGYRELVERTLSRPAEYYYWTEKLHLRDTWEDVLLLCVPIVGNNRQVYGVCGMEISEHIFRLSAPVEETKYGPVTTVLAPIEDGQLMLSKGLIGSTAGTDFDHPESVVIHRGRGFNTYIGKTTEYVGVQRVMDISQEDEEKRQWVAAMLLPGGHYRAIETESRRAVLVKMILVAVLLTGGSVFLYIRLIHPLRHMTFEEPSRPDDTALLIDFVRSYPVTQHFVYETLPEDIKGLMNRFSVRVAALPNDCWRLFRFLAEGCAQEELSGRTGLGRTALRRELKELCERLETDSVDDIILYIDFFHQCGKGI